LVAYLLSSHGQGKDETSIQENLPLYAEIYTPSLAKHGDPDRAEDSLRKQLHRDVEALIRAGITVHIEGAREGRLYSLPPGGFSLVEVDLSDEERAVLVGALRALRRDRCDWPSPISSAPRPRALCKEDTRTKRTA
jgi:hypothetical protein